MTDKSQSFEWGAVINQTIYYCGGEPTSNPYPEQDFYERARQWMSEENLVAGEGFLIKKEDLAFSGWWYLLMKAPRISGPENLEPREIIL